MDALAPKSESLFQVAWAQFRKHRLAVWGGRILLVLYFVAAFAGFFSPYDPNYYELYPPKGYHPPTRIHFVDPETGRLSRPFVYATRRTIDPVSLQPRYEEDPSQGKFYIRFFVRTPDQPYTVFRVFRADLRLFGVDPPGRIFLMGTDNFGRDLFSRLVYGAQVSLTIGILSALVSFALGLLLGGIAGFYAGRPFVLALPLRAWRGRGLVLGPLSWLLWGGLAAGALYLAWTYIRLTGFGFFQALALLAALWLAGFFALTLPFRPIQVDVDNLIMRLVEVIAAIPTLFLLISLRAVFPTNVDPLTTFYLVVGLLGFIGWGGLARVVRGVVLSVREQDYVQAARALGASDGRILARHVLPATASYVIVSLSLTIPGFILAESGLSFLGLGVTEPYTSWGLLLQAAQQGGFASFVDRPWVLWPGFFIFVSIMAWNFVGDGLRDAFDPRRRQ
ncbi:peptide ABC transporter permease [Thermus thermophilus]|uniref:Peptide ABC transporter permease n=1 Tax=Thermus thermophilus TaxID=274 RepID=A0AAD1NWH9_THETH|nr:ABC transporter permease [Thermus thermophilus]BBL81712.1 peptide ABC transporter permease [Thermus thermophilus]BBL84014.1 peptide ABC transporter permease [Thermus thermophilus]BCZ86318.1 peptide ABC transporter permease [Thermus thermophilus]BCZ88713.1 peptide ABC transporter permease [Thermus thermophilus]BCZ91343.1 peptide ABC transporter permease [Thermus thermophilus]